MRRSPYCTASTVLTALLLASPVLAAPAAPPDAPPSAPAPAVVPPRPLGPLSADYPDGRYWLVEYVDEAGDAWTLDLWFLAEGTTQFDLEHMKTLPGRLTPEARAAILRIKHERQAGVAAPAAPPLPSYEVYEAVLDHGVRTPDEFEHASALVEPSLILGDEPRLARAAAAGARIPTLDLARTRSLAARLCAESRVSIGGRDGVKPHHAVRVGDVIVVELPHQRRRLIVRALGERW